MLLALSFVAGVQMKAAMGLKSNSTIGCHLQSKQFTEALWSIVMRSKDNTGADYWWATPEHCYTKQCMMCHARALLARVLHDVPPEHCYCPSTVTHQALLLPKHCYCPKHYYSVRDVPPEHCPNFVVAGGPTCAT